MRRHGLIATALLLWLTALVRDGVDALIDRTVLPPLDIATSTEVRDRAGDLLRAFTVTDGRWRLATAPGDVDPLYLRMLIAYEDKRFRDHRGIDLRAVMRAGAQALAGGRVVSGASTLTMQAARLIEDGPTGEWSGKLRQMRVALALERRVTKDQILALYLTRAPFGGNLEGVRAASFAWFGKPPRRLTPAEAALLVALPQSPETRRPDRFPARARVARARVLDRAEAAGVIDPGARAAAATEPVPTARRRFPAHAPHLAARLAAEHPGETVIGTTIDGDLQARIERLARDAVRGRGRALSVAIVLADHRTGEILAELGSPEYGNDPRQGFVDMTRAPRSPGSTLKPLVYALAFDTALAHPETLVEDAPTAFGRYAPQNFDGRFLGTMTMRQALQASRNIPAVKLTQALGPAALMAALRRAGVAAELPEGGPPGLAVSLGGVGVTLHDMVQLYAGLAEGGRRSDLSATPGAASSRGRLTGPVAAWYVGDILAGLPPPAGAPHDGLAYKTGTSYGHRDAWALGWDGTHVAGVWLGRPDGTPVPGAFGGDLAAPILFQTFARLKRDLAPLPPPPPETLLVGTAGLPPPLRRFETRGSGPAEGPRIAFPPEGARLPAGQGLALKVRDGAPPFTWLADGRPVAISERGRETWIDAPGPGFVTLSVIDAQGRSAQTAVRLD